ncbi:stAR-related lipid transfer protein 7, mitochondrial-like isoform X2 [Belonocnema kinseyi]|uniref:stAR-related lipid transfer protein 7, mitochondrial-like isoform X2 n=1 Tax=Belonocnema kinseyi TaxID=2817044 RepID=UPI00143DDFEE|nr:stAR-related lipid transfer protein 7, mitochondrial-like isoform X2 [Belonocnema kinseyi]
MFSRHISGTLARNSQPNFTHVFTKNKFLLSQCRSYTRLAAARSWSSGKFSWLCNRRLNSWFREHGVQLVCLCIKQLELIAAQHIRRSIEIFQLYEKLWDEVALKELIKSWRQRTYHKTKKYLFGTAGVSAYNWDFEQITDEKLQSFVHEIDEIYKLLDSTLMCSQCHERLVVDVIQIGVNYCNCQGNKPVTAACRAGESWEPFIEREDMIIWRRLESDTGLYAYKVYGSFSDVSAADFLQVQLDVEYRKEWDNTAKELKVIETDPVTQSIEGYHNDIIYWEMIWPRLFANRDYVYQRKSVHNKDNNIVVIASKATDHPKAPSRTDTHRVNTYWSYMVIKSYKDFYKPGIEFGLTYFDDPGVSIPSAVTLWVAMSGLPDYLCRMRQATREYQHYKSNRDKAFTTAILDQSNNCGTSKGEKTKKQSQTNETDNSQKDSSKTEREPLNSPKKIHKISDIKENDEYGELDPMQEEDQGFLNYFFLTRLFA